MSNLVVEGLGSNTLLLGGLGTESLLVSDPHPEYSLEWAGETDRYYSGANGPLSWTLSRIDGADVDTPDSGSLSITLQGGSSQVVSLNVDGSGTELTLSALVSFDVGGSYRLHLALVMPDETLLVTETPIYVM